MKGITIAEQCHVVNILPPVNINGGVSSDVFSLKNWQHATILIQTGVTHAASTVTVEECDDFTPTNHTAIPFAYYEETTAAGDTLSARKQATTSGFATSANDNGFYVIEIDAAQLSEGFPNLIVKFSDPGGATFASAVAILSGGPGQAITDTAIA